RGEPPVPPAPPPSAPESAGFLAALVAVLYTFGGYQNSMNLAGDVSRSRRGLPLGICGGMAIVTVLYLGINAAYLTVLGAGGVAASPLVAGELASRVFGPSGDAIVSAAIFLSAAGFVNATVLHVPRGYLAMARDGLLPPALGRVHPRTQAQGAGLLFFAATALAPLFFLGTFDKLLQYVMFTDALSLAALASSLFVLRRRGAAGGGRHAPPAFQMPGYPLLPAIFLLSVAAVAADILFRQPRLALAGAAVALGGVPLYLAGRRAWGSPSS
ncbi:MAG TPA: amino acid permease, partial [Candidatus Polarisedimenticolia bacterium]|nr:amino acid permease [Candidatus Polarisedimenticolia bacterium]